VGGSQRVAVSPGVTERGIEVRVGDQVAVTVNGGVGVIGLGGSLSAPPAARSQVQSQAHGSDRNAQPTWT
jgi:hypothetical protein